MAVETAAQTGTQLASQAATHLNWVAIMTSGGPIGLSLSALLIIMSVATWAIIIERWVTLGNLQERSEGFLKAFWTSGDIAAIYVKLRGSIYCPAREVFREGYEEMVRVVRSRKKSRVKKVNVETVRRALARSRSVEEANLTRFMTFLAIAASACPFIGLFGTVIGIIRAFQDIGASGSTSLAAVAPGISEALIATALGLVSAIPAVVFYNALNAKVKKHLLMLDTFSIDFLNILERNADAVPAEEEAAAPHA